MKRIIALLIVFIMMLGMCTIAFADGESASTRVTVQVRAATYTVQVPENMDVDVDAVAEATGEQVHTYSNPDGANYIGQVSVSDAADCNYVVCNIQAPKLMNGNYALDYCLQAYTASTASVAEEVWETIDPEGSKDYAVYFAGRTMALNGTTINAEYPPVHLWLAITPAQAASAVSGDYSGNIVFRFTSYSILPSRYLATN